MSEHRLNSVENATGDEWVVYSQPNCQKCKVVKKFLETRSQPFVELSTALAGPLVERFGFQEAPIVVTPDLGEGSVVFSGARLDIMRKYLLEGGERP